MRKFLVLFICVFSFPIFAQNIEMDNKMEQLWNAMSEEQKSAVVKEFLNSGLSVNILEHSLINYEEKYLQGKRRLKKGIIFTSAGLAASALPLLFFLSNDHDAYVAVILTGIPLWSVGGGFIMAGIPITIVGATQTARYKPYVAFAPNGIRIAMEF